MDLTVWQRLVPSPNGARAVLLHTDEVRMSHWIDWAQLVDPESGEVLASVGDSRWSADTTEWVDDDTARLHVRRYPGGGPELDVVLHVGAATADIDADDGAAATAPFAELTEVMNRLHDAGAAPTP